MSAARGAAEPIAGARRRARNRFEAGRGHRLREGLLEPIGAVDLARHFGRQVLGRAVEDDSAGGHADDPLAIGAGSIERVQVGDDGDALLVVDGLQRVHDDLGVARVERGDRFVGEDDAGLLHQRPRDGDALLLSAGQRLRPLRRGLRDVEALEGAERLELLLLGEDLEQAEQRRAAVEPAEHDVGDDVEARHEVELLEDHGAVALPVAQRADP